MVIGHTADLDAAFYRFGTWGIPLATSVVNLAGSAVLVTLMRRRLGRLGFEAILDSVSRIIVASAALAGAAYGTWYVLDRALGVGLIAQLLSVGAALVVGIAVYTAAVLMLRIPEARQIERLIVGRLRRSAGR